MVIIIASLPTLQTSNNIFHLERRSREWNFVSARLAVALHSNQKAVCSNHVGVINVAQRQRSLSVLVDRVFFRIYEVWKSYSSLTQISTLVRV